MKNKSKLIIPIIIYISIISTLLFVFCSWIVTSTSELRPSEITTIIDPELGQFNLENSFEYDRGTKIPEIGLNQNIVDGETVSEYDKFYNKYSAEYFSKGTDGKLTKANSTINAGTYVARYYNKSTKIYSDFEYKIKPTNPQLTHNYQIPTAGQFYNPDLGPTLSNFTCTGVAGDGTLSGSVTFTKSFPKEGTTDINGLTLTISCIFKPNSKNYNSAKVDITIPLKAVARINNNYYSRVELALERAVNTNEVRIIIGANPIIYDDCVIKKGVTLHINYATDSVNTSTGSMFGNDYSKMADTSKAKTVVTLESNKTIIIESGGILEIGGQLSGGGANIPCGATQGSFSSLVLKKDSHIESEGTINCYGYILEYSKNNDSFINSKSGQIYLPFIIRDFRGGSITYATYNKFDSEHCPPFNQIQLENIQPRLYISYNTTVHGYANIYAGDQQNPTTILLVSNSNSSLIQLTNSTYSYIDSKYNKDTECLSLDIYGGASTNSMAMTIKIPIIGNFNVSTNKVYFPLSFRQKISLKVNKDSGQNTASFSMSQKYKLMPGSSLTIDSGAILNASSITVYKETDYTVTNTVGSSPYPSGKGDAKFIVNGEVHLTSLGGLVTSTNEGAFVFLTKDTTIPIRELSSSSGSSIFTSVSFTTNSTSASIHKFQSNAEPLEESATIGVYESDSYTFNNTKYYYFNQYSEDEVNSFTIKYVTNSTESTLSDITVYSLNNSLTLNDSLLPDNTSIFKSGYSLNGWYIDSSFKQTAKNYVLSASSPQITIYASWSLVTFNINYTSYVEDENSTEILDISDLTSSLPKEYTINSTSPTLPDLQVNGYDFLGWYYYENDNLVSFSEFDVSLAKNIIVVARFKKSEKPFKVIYQLLDEEGNKIGEATLASDIKDLSTFNLSNYPDIINSIKSAYGNNDAKVSYYFEGYNKDDNTGWYTDESMLDKLVVLTKENKADEDSESQIIYIYGKMLEKANITFYDYRLSTGHTDLLATRSSIYLIPGTYNISDLQTSSNSDIKNAFTPKSSFNNVNYYFDGYALTLNKNSITNSTILISNDTANLYLCYRKYVSVTVTATIDFEKSAGVKFRSTSAVTFTSNGITTEIIPSGENSGTFNTTIVVPEESTYSITSSITARAVFSTKNYSITPSSGNVEQSDTSTIKLTFTRK